MRPASLTEERWRRPESRMLRNRSPRARRGREGWSRPARRRARPRTPAPAEGRDIPEPARDADRRESRQAEKVKRAGQPTGGRAPRAERDQHRRRDGHQPPPVLVGKSALIAPRYLTRRTPAPARCRPTSVAVGRRRISFPRTEAERTTRRRWSMKTGGRSRGKTTAWAAAGRSTPRRSGGEENRRAEEERVGGGSGAATTDRAVNPTQARGAGS
jgi:hypothetical protein